MRDVVKGVVTFRTVVKGGYFKIKQKPDKHDFSGSDSCWSNSDMFPALLYRAIKKVAGKDTLHVGSLPEGVCVKNLGFLSEVSIQIELNS